jgi:hypothetical protein
MIRGFAFFALLVAVPFMCGADEPKKAAASPGAVAAAPQPKEPTETVVRMTVRPMAAPIPALKYQLLPELSEMNPGNPIQGYLKCFMEENRFFFSKQADDDREKWYDMPLKDLPIDKIRDWGYFGSPLTQADDAARLDTPDWQILLKLKKGGAGVLLPDLQQIRVIARALQVRFRAEVACGQFDKAIITAKTMFAMSRHMSEHPSLVGDLVGIAIFGIAIGPLEEMVQQPGCPNLYWALSGLPSPLISMHKGLQGERLWFTALFLPIDGSTPMSDEQLQQVVDRFDALIPLAGASAGKRGDIRRSVSAKARDETHITAARTRLAEAGFDPKNLKRFPPLQVVLLDEMLAFRVRCDDDLKAMMLPYWQMESVLMADREKNRANERDRGSLFVFSPPLEVARRPQVRMEQRIAMLRCVGALRLYGADHDGHLPARLDDVPVPLPFDPVTGKSFTYRLDGATATIRGAPTPQTARERLPKINVAYEVTMKK